MLRLVRPTQWTKNGLLVLPFLFTLNLYWDFRHPGAAISLLGWALLGFVIYCALSGGTYVINDLLDAERDRAHPEKHKRPLAARHVNPVVAGVFAVILIGSGLAASFWITMPMGLVATGYVALTFAYSTLLKQLLILDVMAVAAGYVIRVLAGAVVIDVPISPWLYLCTILGTLFIAIVKRRAEVELMQGEATNHRETLGQYTPGLLNQMIAIVTPSTLMAYALYTFTGTNLPDQMMLTIPFVIYGLFRYLYLADTHKMGGAPERVLLEDGPMRLTVGLWLVSVTAILFVFPRP